MRNHTEPPAIQTMSAAETGARFDEVVARVQDGGERVLVERDGAPVAAVVSARDLDRLREFERQREERFTIVDEMRAAFAGVPEEEIEREAARSVAESRAELRAERQRAAVPST